MKIQILSSALEDLHTGREFYELQENGAGDYFLKHLISAIDSLALYGGIHRKIFGYHRLLDCRRNPVSIHRSLES